MSWKVEIRDDCKICHGPLPNARYRTYCSTECREIRNKAQPANIDYITEWNRKKREAIAKIPHIEKDQCHICGGWYFGVKKHIAQAHKK